MVRPLMKPALNTPQAQGRQPTWPAGIPDADSPARRLQFELELAIIGAPDEMRWSPRRSLGLVVATNALIWLVIVWGVRALP